MVSKVIIVVVLAFWAKCSTKGSYCESSFSLCTLTNSLVVGVPLVKAMFGSLGVDLAIQGLVLQVTMRLKSLLFVLEMRRAGVDISSTPSSAEGDSRAWTSVNPMRLPNMSISARARS